MKSFYKEQEKQQANLETGDPDAEQKQFLFCIANADGKME
jgi:hypothetical protein